MNRRSFNLTCVGAALWAAFGNLGSATRPYDAPVITIGDMLKLSKPYMSVEPIGLPFDEMALIGIACNSAQQGETVKVCIRHDSRDPSNNVYLDFTCSNPT